MLKLYFRKKTARADYKSKLSQKERITSSFLEMECSRKSTIFDYEIVKVRSTPPKITQVLKYSNQVYGLCYFPPLMLIILFMGWCLPHMAGSAFTENMRCAKNMVEISYVHTTFD